MLGEQQCRARALPARVARRVEDRVGARQGQGQTGVAGARQQPVVAERQEIAILVEPRGASGRALGVAARADGEEDPLPRQQAVPPGARHRREGGLAGAGARIGAARTAPRARGRSADAGIRWRGIDVARVVVGTTDRGGDGGENERAGEQPEHPPPVLVENVEALPRGGGRVAGQREASAVDDAVVVQPARRARTGRPPVRRETTGAPGPAPRRDRRRTRRRRGSRTAVGRAPHERVRERGRRSISRPAERYGCSLCRTWVEGSSCATRERPPTVTLSGARRRPRPASTPGRPDRLAVGTEILPARAARRAFPTSGQMTALSTIGVFRSMRS